ncbi:MAG: cation:proton antiporter [Longimicrobiales bacterium]
MCAFVGDVVGPRKRHCPGARRKSNGYNASRRHTNCFGSMIEVPLLNSLGLILVAAACFTILGRAFGIPNIVAYLVAGLALGPLFEVLHADESLHLIGEVGIALLLFLVGLELSIARIRDVGRSAAIAGGFQVAASFAVAFLIALVQGVPLGPAVLIGVATCFSSTVVAVKLLGQAGALGQPHGRLTIGILLVEDLVAILTLTVLAALGGDGGRGPGDVLIQVLRALLGVAVLIALTSAAARWVLPRLFSTIASAPGTLFIWSLCWCFLLIVAAELLRLSAEIGAFVAGVSLAQLAYAADLRRRVETLTSFFIAVFFVVLGAEMDLGAALASWQLVLALSVQVLLVNIVATAWALERLGQDRRTGVRAGLHLAHVSEFSFIVLALATTVGLIGEEAVGVVGAVALLTIAIASLLVAREQFVLALLSRLGIRNLEAAQDEASADLSDHIIVVGMNALGLQIVDELCRRGELVLAVDTDPGKLTGLPCATLLGSVDYPSVLEDANLAEAKLVVSALQIEDTNALLAYRAREAGVPASIHAFDKSVIPGLEEIGVNHVMLSKNLGVRRIARELRALGALD